MTESRVKTEFPDFNEELPVIEGFEDQSWHNDACPCLINETMHLILYVDYDDFDKCEFPDARKSGDMKKYHLMSLTEDNQVMDPPEAADIMETNDLAEIIAEVDRRRELAPAVV
jgi:hypothetical protein